MEQYFKEFLKMMKKYLAIMNLLQEIIIQEQLLILNLMDLGNFYGQMVEFIKEIFLIMQ